MRRFVIGAMLSCLSVLVIAADPGEIAKKLIGYEYPMFLGPLPGMDGCKDEGGYAIFRNDAPSTGFNYNFIRCGKDFILTLNRIVLSADNHPILHPEEAQSGYPRFHIVDAIVLPRFDFYNKDRKAPRLAGPCMLDGVREADTWDRVVLARFGKRARVTSKNGVLAAWGFDLEEGRIIPLDISRIVCEKPDEP